MPGPGKTEVTHGDRKGRARHMQTIAYSRPMQYATLQLSDRESRLVSGDAIDSLDGDLITVDQVHDSIPANP
jgi:hypothetical protein